MAAYSGVGGQRSGRGLDHRQRERIREGKSAAGAFHAYSQ